MNQDASTQSLNDRFPDEDQLFAYLAGLFENSGTIRIQEQGGITLIYGGSEGFLKCIQNTLGIGSIYSKPFHQLLIFGNAAAEILTKIYPYLLMNKNRVKLACEYQEHINRREGSKIDKKEQIYRSKIIDQIKNYEYQEEFDIDYIDNWIYPYFIGFFDSSARIRIMNKENDYWINIRLKTKYEPILLLFQEIFNLGYVYPARSSYFRWELNYSDAYALLLDIGCYLFQKHKNCEIALKFHEYYEKTQKPLNEDDFKFIETLSKKLKTNSKKSDSNSITILVCEKLIKKIDNFISNTEGWNRSSFVRSSIRYFYLNESDIIRKKSSICDNSAKDHQINLILDTEILDSLDKNLNRSDLIRKMIECYLDYLQKNIDETEDTIKDNQYKGKNPLKLLKEIRK